MCRTGGRRCPSHSNPESVAARNARRRKAYAEHKSQSLSENVKLVISPSLTPAQQTYFKDTVACGSDGNPIPLYHGSSTEFNSFDPSTLGKGNDSWGNGFYFTDQKSVAEGYMSESDSPTANVKEFYLNMTNPLYVDGKENMSLNNVTFTSAQAANILKQHPEAYLQPDNEEGDMSFLGDYAPNYWDKTHHTEAELNQMIDQVSKEYFNDASWVEIENIFGKDHGSAFLHAVHKETGNDGVVVDFGEDGKHYVAWFPTQMKLTSNTNPTGTNEF